MCYYFLSVICGINSTSIGFKTVGIAPTFGVLKHIKGSMPHPHGTIMVDLRGSKEGIKGSVQLPENVTGVFKWEGHVIELIGGIQEINLNINNRK